MPFLRLIALIIDVRPIHPDRTPPTKDQYRKSSISRRSGTGTNDKKPSRIQGLQSRNQPDQSSPTARPDYSSPDGQLFSSRCQDEQAHIPERPRSRNRPNQFFPPDKETFGYITPRPLSGRHRLPNPPVCSSVSSKPSGQEDWWSWTGSNRRPSACKADALPTELQPRLKGSIKWWARVDSNHRPYAYQAYALTT